jgi:hypothetical protein
MSKIIDQAFNEKRIHMRLLILLAILTASIFSSCSAQNSKVTQDGDTLKLKAKILNMLPVGWGVEYKAHIEEIIAGDAQVFNDTLIFGIIVSKDHENINVGENYLMTFKNSGELSKTPYLPAITGTVSKENEIWLITKIESVPQVHEKTIYEGTAMMSNGKALFIWDFADSEAFYLDGLTSWDSKYLNKKIRVEGVLVQFIDGRSVIKDWKILENK